MTTPRALMTSPSRRAPSRPALKPVPTPVRRPPRAPFVALVLAVLGTGLIGLLLLNTALAQGSFQLHDLQRRTAALQDREQQLQIAVDRDGTPGQLAAAARRLGLVPASDPGFLYLATGTVIGAPKAAQSPKPKTSPAPKAVTTPGTATPSPGTAPVANAAPKPATKASTHPSARPSPAPTRRR